MTARSQRAQAVCCPAPAGHHHAASGLSLHAANANPRHMHSSAASRADIAGRAQKRARHHSHVVLLVLRKLIDGIKAHELLLQRVLTVSLVEKLDHPWNSTFRNNAQPRFLVLAHISWQHIHTGSVCNLGHAGAVQAAAQARRRSARGSEPVQRLPGAHPGRRQTQSALRISCA